MDAYRGRVGLQDTPVLFMVNGVPLDGEDTVAKLGLEDDDSIDVVMGGGAEPEQHDAADDSGVQPIILKVIAAGCSDVHFKIKQTTPLRKLMDAYRGRVGLQDTPVWFMVNDVPLHGEDTVAKLGLEDGDSIDVVMGAG